MNKNTHIGKKYPKKYTYVLVVSVIAIIFSFLIMGLVYFDVINIYHDDKKKFFQKKYTVVAYIFKQENPEIGVLTGQHYSFKLNGTVNLYTTSRSAQNPIHAVMKLIPYDVDAPKTLESLWNVMPKTLHYVFPDAIDPNNPKNNDMTPNQVIIPLYQKNSPFGYEGDGIIQYQDENDYGYYLQEKSDLIKVYNNGTVIDNVKSNIKTKTSQVSIGESNSTDKIHIGTYSQTLSLESNKNTLYGIFITIILGTCAYIVRMKLSTKISPNKS